MNNNENKEIKKNITNKGSDLNNMEVNAYKNEREIFKNGVRRRLKLVNNDTIKIKFKAGDCYIGKYNINSNFFTLNDNDNAGLKGSLYIDIDEIIDVELVK